MPSSQESGTPAAEPEIMNYYWNHEHPLLPFTISQPANKGSLPPVNATRTPPPQCPQGKWAGRHGGAWRLIEDHREEEGFVGNEPVTIKDFGPYPAGWSKDPPPPTANELLERQKFELQMALNELDRKSTRSIRTIETLRRQLETAAEPEKAELQDELDAELDWLANLESQAKDKRAELAALTSN